LPWRWSETVHKGVVIIVRGADAALRVLRYRVERAHRRVHAVFPQRSIYGNGENTVLITNLPDGCCVEGPAGRYVEMLVQTVCERAGVSPTIQAPPGIDAVRRKTEDASFLFLLNHNDKTVEVRLPKPGRDLLTCKEYDSTLMLDPPEVAVLREIARG
jgi:hypothetical protein